MPWKARRPCLASLCPNLITHGIWCEEHRPKNEGNESRPDPPGWKAKRAAYLRDHPICVECGAPATDVDHIERLVTGGADEEANYQALCHRCHSRKTAREVGLGR
jgi:5-methylcytosine-specific restriction protein A